MGDNVETQNSDGIRIHIGGLGPTVTVADIEETFSSLGRVSGVDLIRTKGRSMAYMNFHPLPGKTLLQLFSKYNGCSWKQGKLKLEKAKEHYLDCLKREWAEEAKATSETPVVDTVEKKDTFSSKLERLKMEDMQLRIYFPKLRQVKSLPYKGTGKHKYSFQRIEVPPLPIHFCSCEEHLDSSLKTSEKLLTCVNTGVYYEKELNIMSSVMNKLFEKENIRLSADKEEMPKITENGADGFIDKNLDENSDEESEEEEEEEEDDDDDLVMNFGSRKKSNGLLKNLGSTTQDTRKPKTQKDQPLKKQPHQLDNKTKVQKKVTFATPSEVDDNKKMHTETTAKPIEDEFAAILPRYEVPEIHTAEQEVSIKPQQTTPTQKETIKGQSWLQKSSWKNLVGGTESTTTFSISNLVPNITSLPQTKPKSNDSEINNSTIIEAKKVEVQSDDQEKAEVLPEKPLQEKATINSGSNIFVRREAMKKDPDVSDACTFMRNTESVKQWSKARAALGGKASKKRTNDDDSTKSVKDARPFNRQRR